MNSSINILPILLVALFAGCTTVSQSARNCDVATDSARATTVASTVQSPISVCKTTETVVAVVSKKNYAPGSVIGNVGCVNGTVMLDKGTQDGIVVAQTVLICVREQGRLATIGRAEVVPAEKSSTLKLNIRNVKDEDGDLIVVEDNCAANEFRTAPAKFVAEHEVFAVAVKARAVSTEGMLK